MMPPRTVPHIGLGGVEAYEKYSSRRLWVHEGGEEGPKGRGTAASAARNLRFLCVHFVLAAHVVALNCGKLSTQQAGQDGRMWHVA